MKVLALSDTHGELDPEILALCQEADEVWHAGDIGPGVLARLDAHCKTLRAVRGNADPKHLAADKLEFDAAGLRALIVHKLADAPQTHPRPDLIVCGHTHVLELRRDALGVLIINPGACGKHGPQIKRSVVRFEILQGKIGQADVIDFGATPPSVPTTAPVGHTTVLEYASLRGLRLKPNEASKLGKSAAKRCRETNASVHKKAEGAHLVNSYPLEVLHTVFAARQSGGQQP